MKAWPESGMIGLLLVDKPRGLSSHDVVQIVRRLTGTRRVGHTGTLDPLATGLLLLLVGPATRLARFAEGMTKRYRAVIRLGVETTTYDAEGEVVATRPVTTTREVVEAALDHFRGEIEQRPPLYSAIKVDGEPLYRKARRGERVEPPPRRVTIHTLRLERWEPPFLTLDLTVSKGTYVRSLAHDLGRRLGCGGHLHGLRRMTVGPFSVEQGRTPAQLQALARAGRLREALLPPERLIAGMPSCRLTAEAEAAVRHGRVVLLEAPDGPYVRAHAEDGTLVAILVPTEGGNWRPILVLPGGRDVD